MRFAKRLTAFALVVVMLVSTCLIGTASASYSVVSSVDMGGAVYTKLSVTGTSKTVNAHVVTFDPEDNIIPMAYSGSAGKIMTVDQHVAAAIAEGYDVLGAVNGGFFERTNNVEDPLGTVISGGRLLFYHRLGSTEEALVTFGIDGAANFIYSNLKFTAAFNGTAVSSSNSIGVFNKDYTIVNVETDPIGTLLHYYDSKAGDLSDTTQSGVELLCEVLDNTEPAIGETLKGKVVAVNKNSYYGKLTNTGIADNQFVIFSKNDGQFIGNVTGLSVGDTVDLTIEETNADAKSAMESCFSAIHSPYWLANTSSGTYEDFTDPADAVIKHACHNYGRGWTVFGWNKTTGEYGFLVSEEPSWGNGIDLADAADVFHDMTGATEIIRMDGGGSSSMYANGQMAYVNEGRLVPDCILIIRLPESDNIAKDGDYTLSQLYRQGGGDVDWGWDENAAITYPDETGATLTDGKFASTLGYGDSAWVGFHSKAPDYATAGYHSITFNFDETVGVKRVNIYVGTSDVGYGITAPSSIEVLSSDDGSTWESVTTAIPTDVTTYSASGTEKVVIAVERNTKNLQFRLKNYAWVFVSEVEIIAGEVAEHVCSADGSGWKKDAANHWKVCDCGGKLDESAHTGEWETVIEPEIGVEGKKEQRCTICGYLMDEETIAALEETPVDPPADGGTEDETPIDPPAEPEIIGLRGDVTKNNEIDSRDYVFLKRAYFGTYKLDETANLLADVNDSGGIDSRDYVFLKRAYFGTYKIPENIKYVYAE